MHPFNLILQHVLETIAQDYQVPIKIDDYLIKASPLPRGQSDLRSRVGFADFCPLKASLTAQHSSPLDDIIKHPQATSGRAAPKAPFPGALPLSRMKRPDLITELEHYGLSTEGTVSDLKIRLKSNRVLPPKTKRKKVTRPKDRIPPLHDHPPTDELVKTCAFCDSHGNSLSTIGRLRSKATNLSGVEFHV